MVVLLTLTMKVLALHNTGLRAYLAPQLKLLILMPSLLLELGGLPLILSSYLQLWLFSVVPDLVSCRPLCPIVVAESLPLQVPGFAGLHALLDNICRSSFLGWGFRFGRKSLQE